MINEDVTVLTTSRTDKMLGISFPVIEDLGGFFTRSEGAATVMSSLKQLLLTNKGERAMRAEFGTDLRKAVFEPYDNDLKTSLENDIKNAILEYEPRVDLTSLIISWDDSNKASGYNQIYVRLTFNIKGELLDEQTLELIV
jgi:phage baseplate assembly protein W